MGDKKTKVLYWGDAPAPLINTGFGKVAKYILKGLHDTGNYEINIIGVNYFGQFFDREELPYQIMPAKLGNPNDPFGMALVLKEIKEHKYDILFVINDIYVTQRISKKLEEVRSKFCPDLKIVYYYPVDCDVVPNAADFIHLSTKPVTYNNFSKSCTVTAVPSVQNTLDVIPHGVDKTVYKPLDEPSRELARKKFFKLEPNDDTFIFINANRNSSRKDLPRQIYAFHELKRNINKKAMLYLHTAPIDNNIDLISLCNILGLSIKTDIVFPANYNLHSNFFSEEKMNLLYNAGDAHVTTTLGEGWGLTTTDSMSAGLLNIVPLHTSFKEISANGERALGYKCNDTVWIDNSGYRPQAHMSDIVSAMKSAMLMPEDMKNKMIDKAIKYTDSIDWNKIQEQWVKLFADVVDNSRVTFKMESI